MSGRGGGRGVDHPESGPVVPGGVDPWSTDDVPPDRGLAATESDGGVGGPPADPVGAVPGTGGSEPAAGQDPRLHEPVAEVEVEAEGGTVADPVAGPSAAEHPPREWAWIAEWRERDEPAPWTQGVTLAVFFALLVGSAVYELSSGLADRPLVAVAVNVIVAAGLTPAVWFARELPIIRWIAGGAVLGILGGWLGALLFLL